MTAHEVIIAHAYRITLDDEIAGRLHDRAWYRAHPYTLDWPTRAENDVILHALVKLARSARETARHAIEREDAITAAKAERDRDYHAGNHFVYPEDFNVEGQPEFNGAFR